MTTEILLIIAVVASVALPSGSSSGAVAIAEGCCVSATAAGPASTSSSKLKNGFYLRGRFHSLCAPNDWKVTR